MRWTREDAFDTIVNQEASAQGVPVSLIKAIIGAESAFVPSARRSEPKLNDASYGLMQVLYGTARKLGYTGLPEGLLDPATSIHYGTALLAQNLNTTNGDVPSAVSAYNGGFRPQLGFGTPLASGQFRNQDYVNRVMGNLRYFQQKDMTSEVKPAKTGAPPSAATGGGATAGPATASVISGSASKYALIAAGIAAILWLLRKLTGHG